MTMWLVLLSCLFVTVRAIDFQDCGSDAGKVNKVEMDNYNLAVACCELKRGTNVSIDIYFTPNKNSKEVVVVVHGIIRNIEVPFPISNPEVCSDNESGVTCPLNIGVETSYHTTLHVHAKYPSMSVSTRWELKDEEGANIVCVEIPISIK